MKLEAWQPCKKLRVTGTLIRTYPKGVTIDDANGVRWYVTNDRVITPAAEASDTLV
ncbi:hypothetical protein NKJ23_16065 [Mesorhizobium sp. M0184]|uniref:hypothetical protein n=1 Tax=Mesorhizobium sp. M0184 TaxID=2956906 RepID=UPI00333D7C17